MWHDGLPSTLLGGEGDGPEGAVMVERQGGVWAVYRKRGAAPVGADAGGGNRHYCAWRQARSDRESIRASTRRCCPSAYPGAGRASPGGDCTDGDPELVRRGCGVRLRQRQRRRLCRTVGRSRCGAREVLAWFVTTFAALGWNPVEPVPSTGVAYVRLQRDGDERAGVLLQGLTSDWTRHADRAVNWESGVNRIRVHLAVDGTFPDGSTGFHVG
jgi:hypothetical protein